MNNKAIFYLWLILLSIALSGCAAGPTPEKSSLIKAKSSLLTKAKPSLVNRTKTDTVLDASYDSPYYNYVKSELHKNKREIPKAIKSMLKAINNDPDSIYLKQELVSLYLYNKENEKALKISEEIVAGNPGNTEALIILAKLKQMLNHENEAREIYQKILQLDPENENVYLILGSMYMEIDNTDEAFKVYSEMAEHFPHSYAAHFFLGKIHVLKKNPEYAENEFLKTLEYNPDLIEPRLELIEIYKSRKTKKSDLNPQIINLYKKILEIDKYNIKATMELPLYYNNHGQQEKAAQIFAQIGKTKKKQPNFFMLAAKEFIGKKRYKDASIVFTGLLKGAPDNSTLHYLAGISFDSLKESKKAIKHFLKVKPDSRHYKKIVIHIAFLYTDLDKVETAISFLENKHEELPKDIDIITYLASFYEESNEHVKAMATLEKGLVLSPDNSSLSFRLGIVQDKAGKKKECMETMKKIIALEPDNASALNYLGYTYADLGINLDTAEELINKALKIKPSDGFITDSLGWVFFKRGQYEKAIEILVKAAEITSFDPIISEHLADAYKKNNNLKKALKLYKQILSNSKEKNLELEKKIMELEKRTDKKAADKEKIDEKN